jgi:deoxyribodipyrimidine photolyase-related protein
MDRYDKVFVLLGNQLFAPEHFAGHEDALVYMAEDYRACTYLRHHKHKLILILAAMRSHAKLLRASGLDVHYRHFDSAAKQFSYMERLERFISTHGCREIVHFEVQDKPMERRLEAFARRLRLRRTVLPSPMFLTGREQFREWRQGKKQPRMVDFYKWQRRRLDILMTDSGKPVGGQWSFDRENRKPLPQSLPVPQLPVFNDRREVASIKRLVDREFADHPGSTADFMLPSTRKQALDWLQDFLEQRFTCFGDYEDALTTRSDHVFHSLLSPLMNIGLLTPDEVVRDALEFAARENIALNNIEGFVRQIIGWREFIFGIYQTDGEQMLKSNFWGHRRRLRGDWYHGSTGILPLDDVIGKANRIGWAHHIERLMVAGNLMLLAEIHPDDAYRWFMEMFVDSAEWVMTPNVYGMALYADGGLMTTKPYICGANYLCKMGDYPKGDWTLTVDALFWRFMAKQRAFFARQPRLRMLCSQLDRQTPETRKALAQAAAAFLHDKTELLPEVA